VCWVAEGVVEVGAIDEEVWEFVTFSFCFEKGEGIIPKPDVPQPTPVTLAEVISY
jgi:hypothetical protein